MDLSSIVEKWDGVLYTIYNVLAKIKYLIKYLSIRPIVNKNRELKNSHENERCFIVLNGPSLNTHDLRKLKSEYVITTNFFYKSELASVIEPNLHCWQDAKFIKGDDDVITEIQDKFPNLKLLFNIKGYHGSKENVYYTYNKHLPNIFGVKTNIAGFTSAFSTVAFYAINAAMYMGFKKVYILGLDFEPGGFKHFDTVIGETDNPNMFTRKNEVCRDYWSYAKAHYEAYAIEKKARKFGCQIINLNKKSCIRAFQFSDYESVMGD